MRRWHGFAVVLALLAGPAASADVCGSRLLVLSAFPGEIDPLLSRAAITETVVTDGWTFFAGSLEDDEVVLGLSGIGLENADDATRAALGHFGCAIGGVVFSGVSGGRTNIGDVVVPARWTLNEQTWFDADAAMLQAATAAAAEVELERTVPLGDPACIGLDPSTVPTVTLAHTPAITVGGEGKSTDPFGGRAFPCFPGGGDVFGCHPCRAPLVAPDLERFVARAVPFIDPAFFLDYFQNQPGSSGLDADDMETAAVARVASEHQLPFIAFRALSDGLGDPLMLPGFPFQFFVYRQLAAENAARAALAFLRAWNP